MVFFTLLHGLDDNAEIDLHVLGKTPLSRTNVDLAIVGSPSISFNKDYVDSCIYITNNFKVPQSERSVSLLPQSVTFFPDSSSIYLTWKDPSPGETKVVRIFRSPVRNGFNLMELGEEIFCGEAQQCSVSIKSGYSSNHTLDNYLLRLETEPVANALRPPPSLNVPRSLRPGPVNDLRFIFRKEQKHVAYYYEDPTAVPGEEYSYTLYWYSQFGDCSLPI